MRVDEIKWKRYIEGERAGPYYHSVVKDNVTLYRGLARFPDKIIMTYYKPINSVPSVVFDEFIEFAFHANFLSHPGEHT